MDVYVNGTRRFICSFGQTCGSTLTPFMAAGSKDIELQILNTQAGYTSGYVLTRDKETDAGAICGVFNQIGCNGDSHERGIVHTVKGPVTK